MMMLKRMLVTIKGVGFELGMIMLSIIFASIIITLVVSILSMPLLCDTFTVIWGATMVGLSLALVFCAVKGLIAQMVANREYRWRELNYMYKDAMDKLEKL